MTRGITPIDAAFELMGLHQALALTRFIFVETVAGKLVFAVGFISSLAAGLEKGNFRPLGIFLFLFFTLWFLFVMPQTPLVGSVSTMERGGYTQATTTQILEKAGYAGAMVDPVLDLLARWMDALVSGATAVVDKATPGNSYLASPFLLLKVSMLTGGILARGITSAELEEETARFYQDHYWPAVHRLGQVNGPVWPGQENVVSAYTEEGASRWRALRDKLYDACDQDQVFSRMFKRFYEGAIDKDAVVHALLKRELALKPRRYTVMTYDLHPPVTETAVVAVDVSQRVIQALPFIQGGALFLGWSACPAFLAATFLSRRIRVLLIFLGCLLGVKAWTLAWALIDKSEGVWFALNLMWGGPALWQFPALNIFFVLAAVLAPVLVMTGVWLILKKT